MKTWKEIKKVTNKREQYGLIFLFSMMFFSLFLALFEQMTEMIFLSLFMIYFLWSHIKERLSENKTNFIVNQKEIQENEKD
jgi:hypothetical protein